jgi:hypothetical protein
MIFKLCAEILGRKRRWYKYHARRQMQWRNWFMQFHWQGITSQYEIINYIIIEYIVLNIFLILWFLNHVEILWRQIQWRDRS